MYQVGTTEMERSIADITFYTNMCTAVAFPKDTWNTLRTYRYKLTILYYKMVSRFGGDAFSS